MKTFGLFRSGSQPVAPVVPFDDPSAADAPGGDGPPSPGHDARDAVLDRLVDEMGSEIPPDLPQLPGEPAAGHRDASEAARDLLRICRKEVIRRGQEHIPNVRDRVLFELEAVAFRGEAGALLWRHREGRRLPENPDNLMILGLLGVAPECDPGRPPASAPGDLPTICLPPPPTEPAMATPTAAEFLRTIGISLPAGPEPTGVMPLPAQSPPPPATRSAPRPVQGKEPPRRPTAPSRRPPEPGNPPMDPTDRLEPQTMRRSHAMRGMEQLREARRRQQRLEAQVITAARDAAGRVAEALAQDLEFEAIAPRFGGALYAVTTGAGGDWALAIVREEDFAPHPEWTYKDCRLFGVHVRDGLVEAMAAVLGDRVEEDERSLGDFGAPGADLEELPMAAHAGADDDMILSALRASCDEIPVALARSLPN